MNPIQVQLLRWRHSPEIFVREALSVEYIDPWVLEALEYLVKGNRLSIRSGHGVGKSTFLSWLNLWFLYTRMGKICCVAPTQHQLSDVLWTETRKWHRRMPQALQDEFTFTSEKIAHSKNPDESFAVARTARKEHPEALQGFHHENQLVEFDEASGVDDAIFEMGRGALSTPGSKTVMAGNPTKIEGYFFQSFHKNRAAWKCMRVNVEDLIKRQAPYIAPLFMEEFRNEFGRDSNVYRIRILGDFPTEEADSVIPLHLIEAATQRRVEPTGLIVWGLDVARFGEDRSALCKRWGNKVLEPIKWWHGKDNMQVAGLVTKEFNETAPEKQPEYIMVDSIGYGAGVCDRLREEGLPAKGVNTAESAAVGGNNFGEFMRSRDELWFAARDWFEQLDCSFPDDGFAIGELSTVHYDITSTGKLKVESKAERIVRLKGRTGGFKSPDLADSFILTFKAPTRPRFKKNKRSRPKLRFRRYV